MRKHRWFVIILTFAIAGAVTLLKVPLASSQGTTLIAAQVEGDLPLEDLDSPLWQATTAMDVPLSAQTIAKPIAFETRVKSVTARALHNGTQVVFLVEWADDTQNDQTVRIQDFRDAVALEFPLVAGQPFICMGMQGGNVDIWHWKADWQADNIAWQDMEKAYPDMNVDQYPFASGDAFAGEMPAPGDYQDINYVPALASDNLYAMPHLSPVEDIIAGGFGTLTAEAEAGQNVQGYGAWADGKWRVIFSRDLVSPDAEDASFNPGTVYSIAFAAWDGANGERNGEKSTSQWISFQLEQQGKAVAAAQGEQQAEASLPIQAITWIILGASLLLVFIGAVIYLRLPE